MCPVLCHEAAVHRQERMPSRRGTADTRLSSGKLIRKPAVAGEEGETKNCTSLQRTHWSLSPTVTVSTHSRKQLTRHLLTPKITLFRSCRAHKRSGFEGGTFKQRRRLVDPRVSLS